MAMPGQRNLPSSLLIWGIDAIVVIFCTMSFSSSALAESVTAESFALPEVEFEFAPIVNVEELVTPELLKNDNYTLSENAELDGFYCRFHLISRRYGIWDASSLDQLKIRVHELNVLAAISDAPDENGFVKGASEKVKDTGTAVKDTLVTPSETFKAVGRGIKGNALSAFDFVRRKDRHQPKEPLFLGNQIRKLAVQWDVDVYTTNPAVQELLKEKAKMRCVGNAVVELGFSAGTLFVPGAAVALSTVNYRKNLASKLELFTVIELYHNNDCILKKTGISSIDRESFLASDGMTPKQKSEIVAEVATLSQLPDKATLLAALLEMHPGEGVWQVQCVNMLAKCNVADPIVQVESRGIALSATTAGGKQIIVFPADMLHWSKEVAQVFKGIENAQAGQCLISGIPTFRARKEIERAGFIVREQYLKDSK